MPEECLIIAPISTPDEVAHAYAGDADHCRHVIDHLLKPAARRAGFEPLSPEVRGSDVIHASIIRHLESCAMVLCDMSTLNANVFFELGIRTAVNKPFCLVYDEHTSTIPFDTGIVNALRYNATMSPWLLHDQIVSIADHIATSFEGNEDGNSLWKYFGLTTQASMEAVDETSLEAKVDFLMSQVARLGAGRVTVSAEGVTALARVIAARSGDAVSTTRLLASLEDLDATAKQLIVLRFGLDGYGLRTLEDVALELNLTFDRARSVEVVALRKLSEYFAPAVSDWGLQEFREVTQALAADKNQESSTE